MSDDGAGGDRRDDGGDVSRGGTPAPLSVGRVILLANTARGSPRGRATRKHDESLVV